MRKLALALITMLLSSGCVSFTWTKRAQKPFFEVDRTAKIALVSVEVPEKVMKRAPANFRDMRGMITTAVTEAFAETKLEVVDRTSAGYTMGFKTKKLESFRSGSLKIDLPENYSLGDSHPYEAHRPEGLPADITEPLVLGVHVIDWKFPNGNAHIDLAYSMWTRDENEVETRRVRVVLTPEERAVEKTETIPKRSHWMSLPARYSPRPGLTSKGTPELFHLALSKNARAFACPFGEWQVDVSAVWDDSVDAMKPGIALVEEKRYDDARAEWKKLLDADPNLAPAAFNLARVHELAGEEAEALVLLEKAMAISKGNGLYERTHKAIKERHALKKKVALPTP